MTTFFSKAIGDLTAADVASLKDIPEGQQLEFKGDLTGEEADPDLWHRGAPGSARRGPGEPAKLKLFREAVAFANAEGGWLVLGIKETVDKPARADRIQPLPDCAELADRLARAAASWIEPPVPGLQVRAVPTSSGGEGTVVVRVPRSPLAPHRIQPSQGGASFKRIGEESRPMNMREIHEMVLQRAAEGLRLDAALEDLRRRYVETVPRRSATGTFVGLQIMAAPVGGSLGLDHVYRQVALFRRGNGPRGRYRQGAERRVGFFEAAMQSVSDRVQPVVRGGRQDWSYVYHHPKAEHEVEDLRSIEIFDSGRISSVLKISSLGMNGLSVDWILAEMAEILRIVREVRRLAGSGEVEYAIDVDLRYDMTIGSKLEGIEEQYMFGLFAEEEGSMSKLWAGPMTHLPRYSAGADDELPGLLDWVLRDLHNLHRREPPDFTFTSIDGPATG